jgi:hypothetical protein
MTRRPLYIATAALLLSGCAIMNHFSGLGIVSAQKSGIDGSEVVEVTGNHVMGAYGGMATFDGAMLGARWESISPDNVNILVTYRSSNNAELIIVEFDELRVNVNGSITSFKPVGPARIAMPLSYLESMLVADVCKLQLIRGPNVTEGDFAIASNAGTPTAKVSLQRFYDKVRAIKAELAAK